MLTRCIVNNVFLKVRDFTLFKTLINDDYFQKFAIKERDAGVPRSTSRGLLKEEK